jgi:hypothetical protein
VECKKVDGRYQYVFSNKTSDTISLQKDSSSSGKVTVNGNFEQGASSSLNFILSDTSQEKIISDGCIQLNGDVVVSIVKKPSVVMNVPLLNFTCDNSPLKSTRSFKVVTTYTKGKCEKINSKTNVNKNSLSLTISSVTDCGGLTSGEVAAIVICTLLIAAVITVSIVVYLKKRRIIFNKRLDKVGMEMGK